MTELLPLWMVLCLVVLLFSGYPVAFILLGVTAAFTGVALWVGLMASAQVSIFYLRLYGLLADNLLFPAVPLLLFMGLALARSGQVEALLALASRRLNRLPGALPVAVLGVGILVAPSAGLIGAAIGLLAVAALPPMLAQGYRPSIASASVAAAGTLGVILPPAIMLFFLADLVGVPIMGPFTSTLVPAGIMLAGYIVYFCASSRSMQPAKGEEAARAGSLIAAVGPLSVILSVLASIALGWATPSQSGAFGALAALILMAVTRSLSWQSLKDVLVETASITAMVFLIIIAANAFSFVFRFLDGDELVGGFIQSLGLGDWGTLLFILTVIFLLGFVIDWLEIVLITLPIFIPVLMKLDFAGHVGDALLVKVWLATAVALVLQTSFVTPPFGFALFFLRGAAPPSVAMAAIYRGAVPVVLIQLSVLALVLLFPWLSTALPRLVLN